MKKISTIFMALFMCAATWADTTTEVYQFTDKSWSDVYNGWTSNKEGNGYTQNQGVQVTKGTTGAGATTKAKMDNVEEVVVNYCTNKSDGAGSIEIQVGDSSITKTITKTGGTTLRNLTFTFKDASHKAKSGKVTIKVNCTTSSIYVNKVVLTLGEGPGYIDVDSVVLNQHTLELMETQEATLVATIYPDSSDVRTATWSSSDDKIATVSNGVVTAVAAGEAKIIAEADGKKDTCVVTVYEKPLVGSIFNLMQSLDSLKNGDKVVFARQATKKIMGTYASGNNIAAQDGVFSKDLKRLQNNDQPDCIYTLQILSAGVYTFVDSQGKYLCYNPSASNANNIQSKSSLDNNSKWQCSKVSSEGMCDWVTLGTTSRYIQYNSNAAVFACYTGYGNVYLYYQHDDKAGSITPIPESIQWSATLKDSAAHFSQEINVTAENLAMEVLVSVKQDSIVPQTYPETRIDHKGVFAVSEKELTATGGVFNVTFDIEKVAIAAADTTISARVILESIDLNDTVLTKIVPVEVKLIREPKKLLPVSIQTILNDSINQMGGVHMQYSTTEITGKDTFLIDTLTVQYVASYEFAVKDETGYLIINSKQSETLKAGDRITGVRGRLMGAYRRYYFNLVEADIQVVGSATVEPELATKAPVYPTDMSKYLRYDSVRFGSNNMTLLNGEKVLVVNNYGVALPTDKEAYFTAEGVASVKGKDIQLILTKAQIDPNYKRPVSGIKLDKHKLSLKCGSQQSIGVTVLPEGENPVGAYNKNVIWTTDQPTLVRVEQNGVVTALAEGTAKVIATAEDKTKGEFADTCEITITNTVEKLFIQITDVANLKAGDNILIVDTANNEAIGAFITKNFGEAVVNRSNDTILYGETDRATIFTLGKEGENWTIAMPDGKLVGQATEEEKKMTIDGTGVNTWTISFGAGNAAITNTNTKQSGKTIIHNNNSSGGNIFNVYANNTSATMFPVQIYKYMGIKQEDIEPTSVLVNPNKAKLQVNNTLQLQAVVNPSNTKYQKVVWESQTPAIATVDAATGLVSGVAVGEVKIVVKNEHNPLLSDTCYISVSDSVHVTGISMDQSSAQVVEGKTIQLKATILPENADNQKVLWSSTDTTIATVNANGLVTTLRYGEVAIVAASDEFPTLTDTCRLKVTALKGDRYHLMTPDSTLCDGDLIVLYCAAKGYASDSIKGNVINRVKPIIVGTDLVIENSKPMLLIANGSYWRLSSNGSQIGHKSDSKDLDPKYPADFSISIYADSAVVLSQTNPKPQFWYNTNGAGSFTLSSTIAASQRAPIQIYRKVKTPDVPIAVESVSLNKKELTLRVDATEQLTATILPKNAKNKNVTWGILDESIATMSEGLVTAIAVGQTKAWVKTEDGDFTDTCVITVLRKGVQVTWKQIQYVDSLKDGARVIIGTPAKDYVLGIYNYDVSKSNIHAVGAVYSANRHEVTANDMYAYTVKWVGNRMTLIGSDNKYLYMYNTSNNLSSSTTLDDKAKWGVKVEERYGVATIENFYANSYKIYFNKTSTTPLFSTYSQSSTNTADIYLYSDHAADWVEYIPQPEMTIKCGKDTITDNLPFGNVIYDEGWGTESNPYESLKTLTFVTKDLEENISLSLYKGTAFSLLSETVKPEGGTASVNFSTKDAGSYSDTLYVRCGKFNYKIALSATAVPVIETKPSVSLSTSVVNLNIVPTDSMRATASMTFSTKNLAKQLYIKWEKGEVPSRQGESVYILAGNEALAVDFGSATKMDTITRTDEPILFEATAYTEGTYVSTLVFYTPDAKDKSKNVFEERVVVKVRVYTEAPEPSIDAIMVGREVITDQIDWGTVYEQESYQVAPFESEKKVTVVAGYLKDSIRLSLSKGSAFQLTPTALGTQGGQTAILFHATKAGDYTDTLHVVSGSIKRTIALSAKAVSDKPVTEPELTLSANSLQMRIDTKKGNEADAQITFSVANLEQPLFIMWEQGTIPSQKDEEITILAGAEQSPIAYGSTLDMGTNNRENETVNVHVKASVGGTYTSTLFFYSPDEADSSKNVFEQRVTIKIRVIASTDLSDVDAAPNNITKLIKDNHLLIYRYGKWYMANGQIVK